jgi:hypothetical protein
MKAQLSPFITRLLNALNRLSVAWPDYYLVGKWRFFGGGKAKWMRVGGIDKINFIHNLGKMLTSTFSVLNKV